MARRYHTLLIRENAAAPWAIHFGDFDRETVEQEAADMRDGHEAVARKNQKVISTGAAQADIDAAVAKLNA